MTSLNTLLNILSLLPLEKELPIVTTVDAYTVSLLSDSGDCLDTSFNENIFQTYGKYLDVFYQYGYNLNKTVPDDKKMDYFKVISLLTTYLLEELVPEYIYNCLSSTYSYCEFQPFLNTAAIYLLEELSTDTYGKKEKLEKVCKDFLVLKEEVKFFIESGQPLNWVSLLCFQKELNEKSASSSNESYAMFFFDLEGRKNKELVDLPF